MKYQNFLVWSCFLISFIFRSSLNAQYSDSSSKKPDERAVTLNQKDTGYRGIWYFNQEISGEYRYKYSGGLGTYCVKHRPFAIYCPAVRKTFFCYGGGTPDNNQRLWHMVSYYDHKRGVVPKPTILLDKQTSDAHDNPVISMDEESFIGGRPDPSIHFRHRGFANVCWADGHISCETMDLSASYTTHAVMEEEETARMGLGWFGPDDNSLFDLY